MKQFILLSGIFLTINFISACSGKESLTLEYETKIEKKDDEIRKLKEEVKRINDQLEQERKKQEKLQVFDHKARNIMGHIANHDFDKLKNEFDVNLEVIDGKIYFSELSKSSIGSYFPTEIAKFPMYFNFYNPQPDSTEVGYFLYGYDQHNTERKYDIHFRFGKDDEFMYVGTD